MRHPGCESGCLPAGAQAALFPWVTRGDGGAGPCPSCECRTKGFYKLRAKCCWPSHNAVKDQGQKPGRGPSPAGVTGQAGCHCRPHRGQSHPPHHGQAPPRTSACCSEGNQHQSLKAPALLRTSVPCYVSPVTLSSGEGQTAWDKKPDQDHPDFKQETQDLSPLRAGRSPEAQHAPGLKEQNTAGHSGAHL